MLTAQRPDLVSSLVVEEETFPGVDVAIPEPGASAYPAWHGPFNRAVGLAEALVPGNEDAYFGQFLRESAGPLGLEADAVQEYLAAYRSAGALGPSLAYYRTRDLDLVGVHELRGRGRDVPCLAVGDRFAMGPAVADGLRAVGTHPREVVMPIAGHYPAEQEPAELCRAVLQFLSDSAPTP